MNIRTYPNKAVMKIQTDKISNSVRILKVILLNNVENNGFNIVFATLSFVVTHLELVTTLTITLPDQGHQKEPKG